MFNSAATFDACRGKYIALLDGDDYWLSPDKLQAQVNQLEADPGLAAICHYAACMREGTRLETGLAKHLNLEKRKRRLKC